MGFCHINYSRYESFQQVQNGRGFRHATSDERSAQAVVVLTAFGAVAHGDVFLDAGFEGSSSLPAGWTQLQISGGATWAIQQGGNTGGNHPVAAHGGTQNATLFATNANENKTRLISPAFSTTGYTNLSLTFWHTQEIWASDQDELKVFFSSDGGSNWEQLAHYTSSVSAWTQRALVIPTASANSQIAFEGNAKWGYGVCLDDIQVSGIPDTWSRFLSAPRMPRPPRWDRIRAHGPSPAAAIPRRALSVNYTLERHRHGRQRLQCQYSKPDHICRRRNIEGSDAHTGGRYGGRRG